MWFSGALKLVWVGWANFVASLIMSFESRLGGGFLAQIVDVARTADSSGVVFVDVVFPQLQWLRFLPRQPQTQSHPQSQQAQVGSGAPLCSVNPIVDPVTGPVFASFLLGLSYWPDPPEMDPSAADLIAPSHLHQKNREKS